LSLARRLGDVRFQTYVLVSEDDMESGVAWEGALTAAKYRSSEPTVFMDYNDVHLDGAGQIFWRSSR